MVLLLASGCGSDADGSTQATALGRDLDAVDRAIVAQRWDAARQAIDTLVSDAAQARADGDLDAARADRIRSTAARLLAALPERTSTTSPSTSPSTSASTSSTPSPVTPTRREEPKGPKPHPPKDKSHEHGHGKGH